MRLRDRQEFQRPIKCGVVGARMRRRLSSATVCFLFSIGLVAPSAVFSHESSRSVSLISVGFSRVPIGSGGWTMEVVMASDGTKIAREDTYGLWWYNPIATCGNDAHTGCWQQSITAASMPSDALGSLKTGGCFDTSFDCTTTGGADICAANTAVWAIQFNGYVYITATRGQSWSLTNFTRTTVPNQAGPKQLSKQLAFSPQNCNVIYASTPSNGAFYTLNGGSTWTRLTNVGTGSKFPGASIGGGHLFFFDPTDPMGDTVYISTYGTGVYKCTSATTHPSCIELNSSGMPTSHYKLRVDGDGDVWMVTNTGSNGNISKYADGAWTSYSSLADQFAGIAIDPRNGYVYAIDGGGYMYFTLNGGHTWNGPVKVALVANDIPWLASTGGQFSQASIDFDPSQSHVLYSAEGIGIWTTTPPTTACGRSCANTTWTSQSAQIENMVVNWIISPPGGHPIVFVWDRCAFTAQGLTSYPSTEGTDMPVPGYLPQGWSGDWQTGGGIVALCNGVGGSSTNISGYSTNYGGAWSLFGGRGTGTAVIPNLIAGAGNGGCIAIASMPDFNPGSSGLIVTVGTDNGSNANQPYYSNDGGASWHAATISGINTRGTTGWNANYYQSVQNCAADRLNGYVYLYNNGATGAGTEGIYQSSDGSSWARVSNRGTFKTGANYAGSQQMRTVPGEAGELWLTYGRQGTNHPQPTPLYHCSGGGGPLMTCATIWNLKEVWAIGFGKPQTAGSYPAIYIYGWANCGASGITCLSGYFGYTLGYYQSNNKGVAWKMLAAPYPLGIADEVKVIEGDSDVYGRFYVGFQGHSMMRFNFLLGRDFEPAGNDDAPMFLNRAA